MKNLESSNYVMTWAKLLAEYFAHEGWVINAGQNNEILICTATDTLQLCADDELMEKIYAAELAIPRIRLRLTTVHYLFYMNGRLVNRITVFPGRELDL